MPRFAYSTQLTIDNLPDVVLDEVGLTIDNIPMLYKTQGLITKQIDFSESDKILNLFTPKGIVSAIAKGARKPTSRKTSQIDLCMFANFALAKGKNLDVITEVKIIEDYPNIKNNLQLSSIAYFILELINNFYTNDQETKTIFEQVMPSLKILDSEISIEKALLIKDTLTIKILKDTGVLYKERDQIQNDRIYKIMNYIETQDIQDALKLKITKEDLLKLQNLLYNQITAELNKELKTYKLLQKQVYAKL